MIRYALIFAIVLLAFAAAVLVPVLIRLRRPGAAPGALRRIIGLAMILVAAGALLAGQIIASARARREVVIPDRPVPVLAGPGPEGGSSDRYLVRAFTLDFVVPERPRLIEVAAFHVDVPGEARAVAEPRANVGPVEFTATIRRPRRRDGQADVVFQTASAGGDWRLSDVVVAGEPGAFALERPREGSARFGASFPLSVFPDAMAAITVVLLDPVPVTTDAAPFEELMAGPDGARIRNALGAVNPRRDRTEVSGPLDSSERGVLRVGESMGLFVLLPLLFGGLGAILVGRRTGAWLGPYLLLAPLLLVATDRIAFAMHRDALASDRPQVKASAMLGLRVSPFFAVSGQAIVEETARSGSEEDRAIARSVLDAALFPKEGPARRNIMTAEAWRAVLAAPTRGERP